MLSHDNSEMFEVSGKFLSSRHSALEEVESDHEDICLVLRARLEVSHSNPMVMLCCKVLFHVAIGGGSFPVGSGQGLAGHYQPAARMLLSRR